MQKTKLSLFFSLFLIVLLLCPVLAVDSYGNYLSGITIKQKLLGSYETMGTITDANYVENMNVSIESDAFTLLITGKLNTTLATYLDATAVQAVGVVAEGNTTYYGGPLYGSTMFEPIGGFWDRTFQPTFDYEVNETLAVNVTLWHDYEKNGTWTLTDSYLFNIVPPTPEDYTPPMAGSMDLSFVWFWAFIGAFFVTAISGGIAIRKISIGYFMIALFSGMFTYAFYQIMYIGG